MLLASAMAELVLDISMDFIPAVLLAQRLHFGQQTESEGIRE